MSKLNVQFSARQTAALDRLAAEMETTKAGVLKTALALLELYLRERAAGNGLAVIADGVVVKEIVGIA